MGAPMCTSCNKFCSLEQGEPEISCEMINESGEIDGVVRLVLNSSCCSEEVREANLDFDVKWDHTCEEGKVEEGWSEGDEQFEILDCSASETDRMEGKGRYARHYWGADITIECKCNKCGETETLSTIAEEMGSAFEDLN